MNENLRHPPVRSDGTPCAFWYDREGGHVIHRYPDGTLEALGWRCQHDVEVSE